MYILADQNIPFAKEAFAHLGDVTTFVGRELTAKEVHDANILLVRSVTQVNAELLAESAIQFVGSATIGTDHVDLDYLQDHNITFANAPGSNAISAAEYVLAALLHFVKQQAVVLDKLRVGIVGYGNVGSRVASLLQAVDIECQIYDPPRQQQFTDIAYCDWQTICDCDVVTAHVPLTKEGEYPTLHMFDRDFFFKLKSDALFINTARGQAVDEAALLSRLAARRPIHLILDVWQNEPHINRDLVKQTLISTPHIAGYAYDGKLRGTEMIYQSLCEHLGVTPQWTVQEVLTAECTRLTASVSPDWLAVLYDLVTQAYDIVKDNDQLRQVLTMGKDQAARHFDDLRKHYPQRREFSHYDVDVSKLSRQQATVIKHLGFKVYR